MPQTNPTYSESLYSDHLLNQIRSNLDLLLQLSKISPGSVDLIKNALPPLSNDGLDNRSRQSAYLESHQPPSPRPEPTTHHINPFPQPQSQHHPNAHSLPTPPSQPQPQSQASLAHQHKRAKALWSYRGSAADDLSFEKGDIIVVLAEENEDWWKGQVLNSQSPPGLFPSNHVEAIANSNSSYGNGPSSSLPGPPSSYHAPSAPHGQHHRQSDNHQASFSQVQHQAVYHNGPPGPAWQAPPYAQPNYHGDMKHSPPVQQQPPTMVHSQSAPPVQITVEKPKKKPLQGRFGQALVGGAGFGAGSAVASHVVNAIL